MVNLLKSIKHKPASHPYLCVLQLSTNISIAAPMLVLVLQFCLFCAFTLTFNMIMFCSSGKFNGQSFDQKVGFSWMIFNQI